MCARYIPCEEYSGRIGHTIGSMSTVAASLNLAEPGPVVNPNIYGHFAEHLGRGIYEGLWEGFGPTLWKP